MELIKRIGVLCLAAVLLPAADARAQTQAEIWAAFAKTASVGAELTVRLSDGQRFRATLVGTRDHDVLLQPKTRVPVPVQPVPYDAIFSLERRTTGSGAGKA